MALDWAAAWRAWRSFRPAAPRTRAFLLARMAVAPIGPMGPELRALSGRVLSLGCGHGVVDRYVAEINPAVRIDGVDLDAGRVREAAASQDRSPRVRVALADVTMLDAAQEYDAALAIDVLHHVPAASHAAVAEAIHRILRPGGSWIVKEMATEPRRQYLWNRLHDRIVSGSAPIYCRSPEEMTQLLDRAGFVVEKVQRLRRLRLYPQYLVVARKPR
jgi:cyclopropane fatty-acyl-phospholipid synthase-like methyltransferase